MRRVAIALFFVLLVLPLQARQRAAGKPVLDPTSVEGWLVSHGHVLTSTELVPYTFDLAPLRTIVGNAQVVGLGDGTHGTHEFYTVKLRVIDYLVRELGFDVVAIEAPYANYEALNAYVLGGAGNPRAVLLDGSARLGYFFWSAEEILALVEWMRGYNATRGDRPPVQIAGVDIYDQLRSWPAVVEYLRGADPVLAVEAETKYGGCIRGNPAATYCVKQATEIYNAMFNRQAELVAKTSQRAFDNALHHAMVVLQNQDFTSGIFRDKSMADNVRWFQQHRSATGRIVYWAHNEHVTTADSELGTKTPAGELLKTMYGDAGYVAIATMTRNGTYMQWERTHPTKLEFKSVTRSFPAAESGTYEFYLHQRRAAAFLFPLDGNLPQWLTAPARFNTAGSYGNPAAKPAPLSEKFDAAIYIENTTPLRPLTP